MASSPPPRLIITVNEISFFLSHRLNIALEARKRGFEVIVASPVDKDVKKLTELGFQHQSYFLEKWGLNPFGDLRTLLSLYKLYKRIKPDIVHHVTIKPVIYGSLAARVAKTKGVVNAISGLGFIFVSMGFKAAIRRILVSFLYKISLGAVNQRIIVQNPDDERVFCERNFISLDKIRRIRGSGVDTSKFVPRDEPEGVISVLMISRLLKDKGVSEFVAAAKTLKTQGLEARFIIAGALPEGNPGAVTREEYESWKSEKVVEFLGHQKDVLSLIHKSHIVCLPSYREGLPRCLIEAAACGKPIVATDVPGCREIVENEVNGLLVLLRDPITLSQAIKKLVLNKQLRLQMGSAGRKKVEEEGFSEKVVLEQTFSVYAELL